MNIQLDKNYRITNNTLNFTLNKRIEAYEDKDGNMVEEKYVADGYYSNIKHLLKGYFNKSMIENKSQTIQELIDKADDVISVIEQLDIDSQIDRFIQTNWIEKEAIKKQKESANNE